MRICEMGLLTALLWPAAAHAVKVGDAGPPAKAKNQDGKLVDLAPLYGRQPVIVFFYPKSFTGG